MVNLETVHNRIIDGGGNLNDLTAEYVSGTSFRTTSSIDWSTVVKKGVKLEINDGSVKYGYITAVTYAAPNCTFTVSSLNASGSSTPTTLSNATLSGIYLGGAANLRSHPTWITYTPVYTGFSSDPTNVVSMFCCHGQMITWMHREGKAGTSNAATFTITTPITAASTSGAAWSTCLSLTQDAGVLNTHPGIARILASSPTIVTLFVNGDYATGWTNSGPKRGNFEISYQI